MNNEFEPIVVRPPSVIGILGGGQLGRMIALDGRKMGYRFAVLDPTPNCPTAHVADEQVVAPFSDVSAAKELAKLSDVVTYEFENVDADVTATLEAHTSVPQGSALLAMTQHRVREKSTLAKFGLPVTPYVPIHTWRDVEVAFARFDGHMVMKTCRGGYDGKGQWMIKSPSIGADDPKLVLESHREAWMSILNKAEGDADAPLIAEQFIPFIGELSVVVARNARGDVAAFPPAENEHVHHILHLSIVPARYEKTILDRAMELAKLVVSNLNAVGLVAVEMFVSADEQLYINELAPRPHNSGHYTMDACATSQFEQHVRSVCNLPLGDVSLFTHVVMVNILGQHLDAVLRNMDKFEGHVKVHLYGKEESRTDRKMGHINILCDDVEDGLAWVRKSGIWS